MSEFPGIQALAV